MKTTIALMSMASLTSAKCPLHARVELFQGADFSGKSFAIETNEDLLEFYVPKDWNDKVGSFRVYGGCVEFWQHHFTGASV